MSTTDEFRARARATWAAGDWDAFSATIAPVGALVVERAEIVPGMHPPPPGIDPPPLWGDEGHIRDVFGAAGATPSIARETVVFDLGSEAEVVAFYTEKLGPMVAARPALEAEGRWDEFVEAFRQLVRRFNTGDEQMMRLPSDYYVITVER